MGNHIITFNYNTQVTELTMPEYGRNIQQLITYCKTIEDSKIRQGCAEAIIDLMQIITPYNRNFEEHRKKLWHHFFRIAKYEIDVTTPYDMELSKELDIVKPNKIDYPKNSDRYRHYGSYVNNMIQKAKELEDPAKKEAFAKLIAGYMKTAFRNWNREHFVSDESIKDDLANMSQGSLQLSEDITLEVSQGTPRHLRQKSYHKNNKNKFKKKNKNGKRY